MRELLDELSSLHFWVAVVVVGLLVNLLAAYLKPRLDKIGGRFSGKLRRRHQRQAEEDERLLREARENEKIQLFLTLDEMRFRFLSLDFVLLSVLCFVMSGGGMYTVRTLIHEPSGFSALLDILYIVGNLVGVVSLIIAQISNKQASSLRRLLSKLREEAAGRPER